MSSAIGSVRGFTEFEDLCRGYKGYSDNLAQLFDACSKDRTHRQTISFKQALKRLRNKVKDTLNSIENSSLRKVTNFTIGKTYVKESNRTFDPMKRTTWTLGGGINHRWQSYKSESYDGLVAIGCVERDLIPEDVMQYNQYIKINQQIYAVALEQSLIKYYTLFKPDPRLQNKSYDIGNMSGGCFKGGIVYVAYKLEPEKILDILEDDNERTQEYVNSDEIQREFDRLGFELEKIGLNFDHNISTDNGSFFMACCNQFDRVELPQRDHTDLRQMLVGEIKKISMDIIQSKNYTSDTWNEYLSRLSNDEEDVCDLVIESMAKILDKTIVIYALSCLNGLESHSINVQPGNNGQPLIFARVKSYYRSLAKQALKQNKRTVDSTNRDEGINPIKKPKLHPDRYSRSDRPSTSGISRPIVEMTLTESNLIRFSYINQTDKTDWDLLTQTVFERLKNLKVITTIKYYEEAMTHNYNQLKQRIKKHVEDTRAGIRKTK